MLGGNMADKRTFILIIDQLMGHCHERSPILPGTGLQPPNVMSYAKAGMLPEFNECIKNGLFVYSWNNRKTHTPYAQKYLAQGSYRMKMKFGDDSIDRWELLEGHNRKTILSACKERYPQCKTASFGGSNFEKTGWWRACDCSMGFSSPNDFLFTQYCFKWMLENHNWKMVLLLLPQYDITACCPVVRKGAYSGNPLLKDKHSAILEIDKYLWMIRRFLKEKGWWDDSYLFIGSDHGLHIGCDDAVKSARETGVPEDQLWNHAGAHASAPTECVLWDYERNRPTRIRNDCPRRHTFIISGGALPNKHRGKTIEKAEIIDFAPTIAKLMDIELPCDGKSVI